MSTDEKPIKERPYFGAYTRPNYTLVPDQLFDEQLAELSGAELKVLLYLMRRTFGFKKDSDAISLNQIANGITTKDGRTLDHGTGLSKRQVVTALKSLAGMGLISPQKRSTPERGYETTIYRLNVVTTAQAPTPPSEIISPGASEKREQALVKKGNIQQTVLQDTENNNSVVVVGELTERKITKATAERLAQSYPKEHIQTKIEHHDFLVSSRSPLVAKNPAGYLRRAIEDDYEPPAGFKSRDQLEHEAKQRERAQAEADAAIKAEQERQQRLREQEQEKRTHALQAFHREHPPAQIPGTDLTTETAWQKALERLQNGMTATNYHTWLSDTILASCDCSYALVVAPSGFGADWLRTRLTPFIQKELTAVLGFSPELEYLALSDLAVHQPDRSDHLPHSEHHPPSSTFSAHARPTE